LKSFKISIRVDFDVSAVLARLRGAYTAPGGASTPSASTLASRTRIARRARASAAVRVDIDAHDATAHTRARAR
jgi:hypothetical protein